MFLGMLSERGNRTLLVLKGLSKDSTDAKRPSPAEARIITVLTKWVELWFMIFTRVSLSTLHSVLKKSSAQCPGGIALQYFIFPFSLDCHAVSV